MAENTKEQNDEKLSKLADSVLVKSEIPVGAAVIKGYDFNNGCDYNALLESMLTTGFQAQHLGKAINEVKRMLAWDLSQIPYDDEREADEMKPIEARKAIKTRIFLGYTSNLISSGLRETIRWLVEHKMVDVVVSTAGGIEEDFIKCMADTYSGEFTLKGADLRMKGLNRTGNLIVPNRNYVAFEEWIMPILDAMLEEQKTKGTIWSPSTMIHRFGKEINNPESVYYWAYKNNIPVFSPAITDGSIGDMIYMHSFRNPGLIVDIASDIRKMNDQALDSPGNTGMLILGGGLIKHHICNANLMRNGADFSVFINTAHEFDGSDAGARPDEAKSWGKIKLSAKPVKVCADATLVFPLLVAQTFVKHYEKHGGR
eukprot:TRINITY_DN9779_c0_g1_i1.p1 TRINITY_DN9779_c0_g1~~TRINITY_DN9779_c0_g1_i1.p1  ORF type:complete len:371 (-),score=70.12 TRINITY_DN9779_c0_g1_i1:233-1345(-)